MGLNFFTLNAVVSSLVSMLPGPNPVSGEYIQPFAQADGTQLISLSGWDTYDSSGLTTVAANRNRLQVKNAALAAATPDYAAPIGALAYLRDVGSVNQVVRFRVGDFVSNLTETATTDGSIRILFGAVDQQNLLYLSINRTSSRIPFIKVFKVVAGVSTEFGSTTPLTGVPDFARDVVSGDSLEIRLRGTTVHLYCNGVLLSPSAGWTVTGFTPGSKVGFGSGNYNVRLDDYYAAPLTATSVTVDRSMQLWPSSLTGRLVTITGTTTGAPTALQTRVISAVDQSEISPWTTNASAVFGAGTFSVSVFEPVGNLTNRARYITQVRPIEDVNGWSPSNAHAVGPTFVFYGQSNSARRDGGGATVTGAGNAYFVLNGDAANNGTVNAWQKGATVTKGLAQFSKTLSERLGMPVGIICCGVGAQPVTSLAPSGTSLFSNQWTAGTLNPWNILIETCRKTNALGYVHQLIWTQGEAEADSFSTTPALNYLPYFQEIASEFRSNVAISPSAPIGVAVIGSFEGTPGNGATQANINWPLVRQTLVGLPAQVSNCYVSSSLMHQPHLDEYHYTGAAYAEMNRRDALTAAKLLGVSTYDGRGPIITSGTRSGNVITMAVNLNGAASIAGSAIAGFDVSADNFATMLAVSSVDVSGGNVVITLASDPGTAVKVRSYWGYRPTQTSVITGSYADGTTIQAEPIYNPITVN